jgi:glutaredoxin
MSVIRWLLARVILLVDFLFKPSKPKLSSEKQQALDSATKDISLYQYAACPFCVKVRWAARRQGLNIETRDAKRNKNFAEELEAGGGKLKVPCLRIEKDGQSTWMYESSDIISYLQEQYA